MKQHEREYFVSRIRSGKCHIKYKDLQLVVLTPTVDDLFFIEEKRFQAYSDAVSDGIKTDEQMQEWMTERGFWSKEKDEKMEGITKDIENTKVTMYENRFSDVHIEQGRNIIKAGEEQYSKLNRQKGKFFNNTCEGVAIAARVAEYMKRCTYFGSEVYDFSSAPIEVLSALYYSILLSEKSCRELARTEPWKALWIMKDHTNLFANDDRELSLDQRNILVWSNMYDSVQESMDCPADDVIDDDDLLDGWFVIQRRKREQEKNQNEVDNMNPNISRHQEVFMPARNKKEAERINNLNSTTSKIVKQQRFNKIKSQGQVKQSDFKDEQIKMRQQINQGTKDRSRR